MDNALISSRLRISAILVVLAAILVGKSGARDGDVLLQFYMNQVHLWNQQSQLGKLQAAILPGLRAFCGKAENFNACGINATLSVEFTASNIVVSQGYPRNVKNRYLDVRIRISYPVGLNEITLTRAAVTEIAENQRDHVSSLLGYHLFYINDVMYLPPPPTMANRVLVPLFVLSTLVLIIVALVMKNANDRKRRKRLQKRLDNNEMQPPQQGKNSRYGNKVGASATNLETGETGDAGRKAKTDRAAADDSRKIKKKKKKSGVNGGDSNGGKEGAKKAGKGDFNNIGFNKSINEGDPRTRRHQASELANEGGGNDSSFGGNPRASQSALSEVIHVRGDSPEPGEPKKSKAKKSPAGADKTRGKHASNSGDAGFDKAGAGKTNKSLSLTNSKKDSEEVMLIDEGVFKPPEANIVPDQSGGSDIDDVPTLNDSSEQQMI